MIIDGKPTIVSVTRRTAEETQENIRRYHEVMAGQEATDLLRSRGKIVADLRREPHGRQGEVDSRYDRWYRPEHWIRGDDEGVCKFIGPDGWFDTLRPDPGAMEAEAKAKAEKIARARAALAGVEAKLGVTPVTIEPPVTETVTETTPAVTETEPADDGIVVTGKARPGRPKKEDSKSGADRTREYRERQRAEKGKPT